MTMTELKPARILAIESSCDETAAAVIENGSLLLANTVATQIELHKKFGGVFPEVASRQHTLSIYPVVEETLQNAHLCWDDIDAIAATRGPGLAGSLVVGFNAAKGIAMARNLPLIGVNHLEGHIYSSWVRPANVDRFTPPEFPVMALLVSGGHTELNLMEDHLNYRRLGATLDDAAGEAFDKVARLLNLAYPGGPSIQKAAEAGNSMAFNFPRAKMDGGYEFSFSGLKTAVLRTIKQLESEEKEVPVADMAASFQAAVVDVLLAKTLAAARQYQVKSIVVAGGVSANKALRTAFTGQGEFPVHIPPLYLCTDNAAMIAAAGYFRYVNGHTDTLEMDVLPNWPLSRNL